ncbi:MAG: FGGY family carbohydrate kinase [Anaerolineales bacterium]
MDYVIGCDVGSQGVKAVLLSLEGNPCAQASMSYSVSYPRPAWAEQSPEVWLSSLAKAIRSLLAASGTAGSHVRAIGVDAQLDGVIPVDREGQALRPAIVWMDRRAVPQCHAMAGLIDPKTLFHRTGLNIDPSHVAPKIRWIMENEVRVSDQCVYWLLPTCLVTGHLTGEVAIDASNASCTMLFDVQARGWSEALCDLFAIDPRKLPPIRSAYEVLGGLHLAAAEELGLPAGIPVVVGCGDEQAATLGAGVTQPGQICDVAGTAEPVCAVGRECLFDEAHLVETHCHAVPDHWFLENPGFLSGANLSWFRDQFVARGASPSGDQGVSYFQLDQAAASIPSGAEGLLMLPCLMGAMTPTWNASARGTFFGFTLAHRREHFIRAVLEASAYALRDITDRMRAIGLPTEELRVVGGGARSRLWCQIKSDVTGIPACVPEMTDSASIGSAMLALVAIGAFDSFPQAAGNLVRVREAFDPDPAAHARYEECYQLYRSTYFALEPVFGQAARNEN